MAFESSPVLDMCYTAGEDLSSYQYHFVKIHTDGTAMLLDGATEIADGVLQNAPIAGEGAVVRHLGISRVVANAALDEGAFVKPEYVSATDVGKAQAQTTTYLPVAGRVVGASGAKNDLASVLLLMPGATFPKLS
jgi:hypothetical protein